MCPQNPGKSIQQFFQLNWRDSRYERRGRYHEDDSYYLTASTQHEAYPQRLCYSLNFGSRVSIIHIHYPAV